LVHLGRQRRQDLRGLAFDCPELLELGGLLLEPDVRAATGPDQVLEQGPSLLGCLGCGIVELLANLEGGLEVVPGCRQGGDERLRLHLAELGLGKPILLAVADRVIGLGGDELAGCRLLSGIFAVVDRRQAGWGPPPSTGGR
jgi:hypothetical protein